MPAAHPDHESSRIRELESYQILDSAPEAQYDAIARLAAVVCETSIATVSLVDRARVWFKSHIGVSITERELHRHTALCAHAIGDGTLLEVADTSLDRRFQACSWVTDPPLVRFYAGMPLMSPGGFALGALAVMDPRPRQLLPLQRDALRDLSAITMSLLERRRLELSFRELRLNQERELELAEATITNLVDAECLNDPCLERVLIPAGRFSGDVIAVRRKPGHAICGMVADVTGHGLSSALYVIPTVQAFYRMCAKDLAPEVICFELNAKIRQLAGTGRFMAAIIFEIDPQAQTVSVWNGGMPAALYLDPAGTLVRKWSSGRPALGVLPDDEFDAFFDTYRWSTPGQFLAFSDGLVDASIGLDPTASILRIADILLGTTVPERVERLLELVSAYRGRSQHDDIAIFALDCERLANDMRKA